MPKSTPLEREIYEQYIIKQLKLEKLINIVNPTGGRMDKYYELIESIINKYGLPRY